MADAALDIGGRNGYSFPRKPEVIMRIAFTHNLRTSDTEAQAEFDSASTITALSESLRSLGHEVHLVEVSGPASRLVARLEALRPDLVFNTAEGDQGRYREAFYPALFEQLRLPFTGSDAYVCALSLDKRATKLLVRNAGVQTPAWVYADKTRPFDGRGLKMPVIVKPNFEGSSKGITADSIVRDRDKLDAVVNGILARYPTGVLVEEFIVGRDMTVPFLEAARPDRGGVLEPASYRFDVPGVRDGFVIYDYKLKNDESDSVVVEVPARATPAVRDELIAATQRVIAVLELRDLGRIDYRVTEDGEVYFIEVNALPSLEPGASIYESSRLEGLDTVDKVLGAVVDSAARRQSIAPTQVRSAQSLLVGVTYNLKRVDPRTGDDRDAEFDAPTTVAALASAIETLGHRTVLLEATPELPQVLAASGVDLVFNIAEGIRGSSRESQVPALLELLDIEYTGSDPASLGLTLDKGLAKRIVREADVATPLSVVVGAKGKIPDTLRFPVIVKPNAEGSSKGVHKKSVVTEAALLREAVDEAIARYGGRVLIEEYLPGREFTVAILGELEPRALPPMEIVFDEEAGPHPVYTFEHKLETESGVSFQAPATVDEDLGRAIGEAALGAYAALGCRDVARIDLRLDADGVPNFIECNPLPGLVPSFSDLCIIAESSGMDYVSLIGEIMGPAVRRWLTRREVA